MQRFVVTSASLPDLVSHVMLHICIADCSVRRLYPWSSQSCWCSPSILDSKVILFNPSCLLFRSLHQPHRDNASKVSLLNFQHATDISRYDLDVIVSMPGSIDPIGLVWGVPEWLHHIWTLYVSRFTVPCLADIYSLNLEPAMLPSMPNMSVWTPFAIGVSFGDFHLFL